MGLHTYSGVNVEVRVQSAGTDFLLSHGSWKSNQAVRFDGRHFNPLSNFGSPRMKNGIIEMYSNCNSI